MAPAVAVGDEHAHAQVHGWHAACRESTIKRIDAHEKTRKKGGPLGQSEKKVTSKTKKGSFFTSNFTSKKMSVFGVLVLLVKPELEFY